MMRPRGLRRVVCARANPLLSRLLRLSLLLSYYSALSGQH
jgi:hypothetical protein